MATSIRCARCMVRATAYRLPSRARRRLPVHPIRSLSSTSTLLARQNRPTRPSPETQLPREYFEPDPEEEDEEDGEGDEEGSGGASTTERAEREERINRLLENIPSGADGLQDTAAGEEVMRHIKQERRRGQVQEPVSEDELQEVDEELGGGYLVDDEQDDESMYEEEPMRYKPGFFSYGEEKEDPHPDPEFNMDDISSTAHANLEQVREMRELARCIAWDMPLLFNHAKPFVPPTTAEPLRWRYTTYMGDDHPASRKVVVTFAPEVLDRSLTQVQQHKLIKLLGSRYNPETKQARMSCELHPTTAQNKRHLGDLIDKLIAEAKDPADTFEDVPFDFRHHKPKKQQPVFPEEWKLTEERKASLEAKRREQAKETQRRRREKGIVDGVRLLEGTGRPEPIQQEEPVLVEARHQDNPAQPSLRRPYQN